MHTFLFGRKIHKINAIICLKLHNGYCVCAPKTLSSSVTRSKLNSDLVFYSFQKIDFSSPGLLTHLSTMHRGLQRCLKLFLEDCFSFGKTQSLETHSVMHSLTVYMFSYKSVVFLLLYSYVYALSCSPHDLLPENKIC